MRHSKATDVCNNLLQSMTHHALISRLKYSILKSVYIWAHIPHNQPVLSYKNPYRTSGPTIFQYPVLTIRRRVCKNPYFHPSLDINRR